MSPMASCSAVILYVLETSGCTVCSVPSFILQTHRQCMGRHMTVAFTTFLLRLTLHSRHMHTYRKLVGSTYLQKLPSSRNRMRAVGESALALLISALNGEVRKTGWMAARCSPRASAVCRRASESSNAARSSRSLADSCAKSITNVMRDRTIVCMLECRADWSELRQYITS